MLEICSLFECSKSNLRILKVEETLLGLKKKAIQFGDFIKFENLKILLILEVFKIKSVLSNSEILSHFVKFVNLGNFGILPSSLNVDIYHRHRSLLFFSIGPLAYLRSRKVGVVKF